MATWQISLTSSLVYVILYIMDTYDSVLHSLCIVTVLYGVQYPAV